MAQSKADSFSAYLEAKQRSNPSASPSLGTALSLLNILTAAPQKTMAVTGLMTASGMAFTDFAEAFKSLRESGYLTVSGGPSAEVATLTALGEEVSRLSRSK